MKQFFARFKSHIIAFLAFLLISLAYNAPQLSGKKLKQEDMTNFTGMARELVNYEKETGHPALWTNALFAGMPAYQIYLPKPGMMVDHVNTFLSKTVPQPAGIILLMCLGFYFMAVCLGIESLFAAIGAIAFAFSSYNVIILDVGHITKALALAYSTLVVAGMVMIFKGKRLNGFAVLALGFALELYANHFQMTYYLGMILVLYGIYALVEAIRTKAIKDFFISTAISIAAVILGVGANYTNLAITFEYQKETMRGESELKALENKGKGSGLDKDYAFNWSYGKAETGTLLIPNFNGGASGSDIGTKSNTYTFLTSQGVDPSMAKQFVSNAPTYFGYQPGVAGPTYLGAIVIFLFLFAMLYLKSAEKWWILAAFLLMLMISWGKNFPAFTDFFFDNVPLYNKFRAVSMALSFAALLLPYLGIRALQQLKEDKDAASTARKPLLISAGITAGFSLLMAIMPSLFFDFSSPNDQQLDGMLKGLAASIIEDRESMFQSDAFRSFFFILLAAAGLWAAMEKKIKMQWAAWVIAILVLIDLWGVDKRYLNDSDFKSRSEVDQPYSELEADATIKQDTALFYRVLDFSNRNPFNENRSAYFHNSVGGYHPAKLARFEDVKGRYLEKMNPSVMAMFNTRWVIVPTEQGNPVAQRNLAACGNAWFVPNVQVVKDAKAEIDSLDGFDPRQVAFVDKRYEKEVSQRDQNFDAAAQINLIHYSPDTMVYNSQSISKQLAVFSEMYYAEGWNAYVDGKPAPYLRANYCLRAMMVPAGQHRIEFRFEPQSYYTGEKISMASSLALFLSIGLAAFMGFRKKD